MSHFNFDDERIVSFSSEDFQSLLEALMEISGNKKNLFFDEIQNIKGWELFINRLLRQGNRVFITGSNANLLSKELGTHLTGRHVDIELYPFSFKEFLAARNVELPIRRFYSTEQKTNFSRMFKEYLYTGGMPETVVLSNDAILIQIINDIIQKDVISRYSIRKPLELKTVIRFLIANASNTITYRSIVNNFGIESQNTLQKYIQYAEETYIIFQVKRFEKKLKKFDKNPKKIYCIDSGIILKNSPSFAEKLGSLLENIVAVHLKRLGKEIYYYKSRTDREADFVIPRDKEVLQVCYEMNAGNKKREIRGAEEALNALRADKATILTFDQEQELSYKDKKIDVKPVWQWLLESEMHDERNSSKLI